MNPAISISIIVLIFITLALAAMWSNASRRADGYKLQSDIRQRTSERLLGELNAAISRATKAEDRLAEYDADKLPDRDSKTGRYAKRGRA